LDVSNCPDLNYLNCETNLFTSLNITNNIALQLFICKSNQLTSLDITNNPALFYFNCGFNNLIALNLNNGNNTNITSFNATNNPNLTCIQVDNASWSTANWLNKDATASYSEDCGWGTNDSDGDGITDDMDDYPGNATMAFDNYFPATSFGSLGFEDLWPSKGDYDFNDLVVGYKFQTITNATNKVVEIKATFVLKASGASMQNGFGFNLPDASQKLISGLGDVTVSGFDKHENYVSLNAKGWENAQSKPTIIVFDDIFNLLEPPGGGTGVNTVLTAPFIPYDTLRLTIIPASSSLTASDFSLETWNPFMIVNHDRGIEVHLSNHLPTDLANLGLFGTADDDTNPLIGKYYKTSNNLPYVIDITETYTWPIEKVSIDNSYLHFIEWASTSGIDFEDWFQDKTGYRNTENLYIILDQ